MNKEESYFKLNRILEYRILEYLSKNVSDRYVDIYEPETAFKDFKKCLDSLKSRELIDTEKYPEKNEHDIVVLGAEQLDKCKITLSGMVYLANLEKLKIDFELARYEKKVNRKLVIFGIILTVISLAITLFPYISNMNEDKRLTIEQEHLQQLSKKESNLYEKLSNKVDSLHALKKK